mgnify:CR=1 FL=1
MMYQVCDSVVNLPEIGVDGLRESDDRSGRVPDFQWMELRETMRFPVREKMKTNDKYGGVPPPPGCIYEGTLTKKMLLSLPEGAILLSNCFNYDRTPAHMGVMPPKAQMEKSVNNVINIDGTRSDRGEHAPLSSREAIWGSFRKLRLTGRKCYAFKDRASAKNWLESIGSCFPVTAARG